MKNFRLRDVGTRIVKRSLCILCSYHKPMYLPPLLSNSLESFSSSLTSVADLGISRGGGGGEAVFQKKIENFVDPFFRSTKLMIFYKSL